MRIALDTYVHLAELDHVKAVKDATGDIAGAVRKRMETGLTLFGDDALYLPFLSIGAVGIISVVAHAAAKPMRELAEAFDRGDIAKAQGLANRIAPAIEAMNGTGLSGHGKGGAQGARHHGMHNNASAEHRAERRTDRSRTRRPAGIRSYSGMIRTQRLPKR